MSSTSDVVYPRDLQPIEIICSDGYANNYQLPKQAVVAKRVNDRCCVRRRLGCTLAIVALCLAVLILIIGIIFVLIFAIIPCSLTKCHSRASKCVNTFFKAKCYCDYPYQGDGLNYCDECGVNYASPNIGKIVGGVNAVANSWPSIAFIRFEYKGIANIPGAENILFDKVYSCGGVLIDRQTILTAAHCVPDKIEVPYDSLTFSVSVSPNAYFPSIASMYTVFLGGQNKSSFGVAPSLKMSVSSVIKNENFQSISYQNDIAMLKLDKQVTLNEYIQIACLPDPRLGKYPPSSDVAAFIAGWGTLSSGGAVPDQLNNVKITIYDGANDCSHVLPSIEKNWDSEICAGSLSGGKDSCQGDSGGPLYVFNSSKYILAGLVSFGDGCGQVNLPGIYTRVSYFYDWIQSNKN